MEEKLIQLIVLMDNVYNEHICNCGSYDNIIENFNYEINKLFNNYPLNDEILMRIKFLDCRIFDENYCYNVNFKNNKFRKQISKFLQTKVKAIKVQFNYNLVYKYIEKDYKLISYLDDIKESDYIKLAIKNPKILYLKNNISSDMLLKILEKNPMTSLIIDCDIMLNDELYKKSYLYKNRDKLLKNKQLYNQFISSIKTYLEDNLMKYLHMSEITRNDVDLAQYILPKEPRLIAYAGKEIYKNKKLMIQMIKIDNSYDYYLDDSLKYDKDIISLLNDPNHIYLIGLDNNKIIAHSKITIIPTMYEKMNTYSILNHVCVKPEYRRHNIATKMLDEITKNV